MSDELMILIELLTVWILKAFSFFVPKGTGGRMGTVQMGTMPGLFPPTFFLTSENIFFFLPFILYTLSFSPSPPTRPLFEPNLSLPEAILSLPNAHCSLLEANCSLLRDICSILERGVRVARWQVSSSETKNPKLRPG